MKKSLIIMIGIILAAIALTGFLVLTGLIMYRQNHAIPILEYHNFSAGPVGIDDPWTVSEISFSQQMAYLSRNCRVVPLRTLLQEIEQGMDIPDNTVAITFDDGYRSNYQIAFPVIKQYQMPVTIFIVGEYIEKGLVGEEPALQWNDMKEMTASGLVDIESHTYNMHYLVDDLGGNLIPSLLSYTTPTGTKETDREHYQRIENDLAKSSQIIQQNLGTKPDALSWPFGACDNRAKDIAKKAGFHYMMSLGSYSNPMTRVDEVYRLAVYPDMDMNAFKYMVQPYKVSYFQAMKIAWLKLKYYTGRIL